LKKAEFGVISVSREGEGAAEVGHGLTNGNGGDADSLNQEFNIARPILNANCIITVYHRVINVFCHMVIIVNMSHDH